MPSCVLKDRGTYSCYELKSNLFSLGLKMGTGWLSLGERLKEPSVCPSLPEVLKLLVCLRCSCGADET